MGLDDGGFAEGLLEVVDDLDVALLGLLQVLALADTHSEQMYNLNKYIYINVYLQ